MDCKAMVMMQLNDRPSALRGAKMANKNILAGREIKKKSSVSCCSGDFLFFFSFFLCMKQQ